jgi:hypothetical protein
MTDSITVNGETYHASGSEVRRESDLRVIASLRFRAEKATNLLYLFVSGSAGEADHRAAEAFLAALSSDTRSEGFMVAVADAAEPLIERALDALENAHTWLLGPQPEYQHQARLKIIADTIAALRSRADASKLPLEGMPGRMFGGCVCAACEGGKLATIDHPCPNCGAQRQPTVSEYNRLATGHYIITDAPGAR